MVQQSSTGFSRVQPGFPRELQTCTFWGSRDFKNTTKIPREDTQRDTQRAKRWRESEQKREILGQLSGDPHFSWYDGSNLFGGHQSQVLPQRK